MKIEEKGFTLVELIIVVTIIGILASVAIGLMLSMKEKANIKTLESDLSSAYKTAIIYFSDEPDKSITLEILKEYGFNESEKVEIRIVEERDAIDNLLITATHQGVSGVYQVDKDGSISKQ